MAIFRKFSFYLAILGIVTAIIFVLITHKPNPEARYAQKPSSSPFDHFIAGDGIVETFDKNVAIGVPVDAIVQSLFVQVGDQVKKDDPLFQLDTRQLDAERVVKIAQIDVQQSILNKQKDKLDRYKTIEDPRALSTEQLQTFENDVKVAQKNLDLAIAELTKTKKLLERLTIRAPSDGAVLQVEIRHGEMASNTRPLILFGDLDHLQVRVNIDEELAGKFDKTQPAVAFPQNNTSISIPLKFVRIDPYVIPKKSLTGASNERIDTRVLQVIYSFIPPKNYPIYVGQLVDVYIQTNEYIHGQKE